MASITEINQYLSDSEQKFQDDLFTLLRIPSISADPAYADNVQEAALWMVRHFEQLKFDTELIETDGYPLIFAQSPHVAGAPTVLVYGHYDVQPADPLEDWITPAFEPTIRDGNVYARGATDDKGQMLTHVKSAQAWIEVTGGVPLNLKFLIEGEEEVGSENLEAFLATNQEKLACDCVVVSDTSQFAPGQPAITYGLRGIVAFELTLTGPSQDLHSGCFGGAVTNPANALAKIVAALHDDEGRVTIPGFYDDVAPLSPQESEAFESLPFDEAGFFKQLGVSEGGGEAGYSTLQRRWSRPTCDVNGLTSGYQGAGPKTIVPSWARVKFTMRLVPNQDPQKIIDATKAFIDSLITAGLQSDLSAGHAAPGVVVSLDSPYMTAAAAAIKDGFGRAPVMIREGGSIPIVTQFAQQLDADVLLLGWGLPDDNTHSPNEKFCLADFHRGIKASASLWQRLAELNT